MADGGAGSKDAFRIPKDGEELSYPFSQFVVRYGNTSRLSASTAATAGVLAELRPSIEEPYRLIYFVVMDQMRTTIAVLRAVLKEGLEAPTRLPKALVIDQLHTLEVFRKQGLATSLTNFVKGMAEAHGIGLYAYCEGFQRGFWEMRGFEEETSSEVLSACCQVSVADLLSNSTLLRAGVGYTEYQPANEERPSITRRFDLTGGQCGDKHGGGLMSGPSPSRVDPHAPGATRSCQEEEEEASGSGGFSLGSAAAPAAAGIAAGCGEGRGLTNQRLARHDEEEEAKSRAVAAAASAAATAAAATPVVSSLAALRNGAGAWPGVPQVPSPPLSLGGTGGPAAAAAIAQTSSGICASVAGYLGWTPTVRQIRAATMGAGRAAALPVSAAAAADKRSMAAKGLLAIPSSGHGADVVDLTDRVGGQSLAEQEEEEMQLAIAMSLSVAESSGGGEENDSGATGNSGDRHGATRGYDVASGDDTETEEDVDNGAQFSSGDADTVDGGSSPQRKRAEVDGDGSDCSCSGGGVQNERACGRGAAEAGGHDGGGGGSRRIRRRRDESGASTPGEQSPNGADVAVAAEGGTGMELDDAGGLKSSAALAPLNAAVSVSSFHRAGLPAVPGRNGGGSGDGGRSYGYAANVCVAAATRGADENGCGVMGAQPSGRVPRRLLGNVAAVATGNPTPTPSSPLRARVTSSCPAPCPSYSFSESSRMSRSTAENQAAVPAGAPAAAVAQRHASVERAGLQPQNTQLHLSVPPGDGGGMIGALGGVVGPTRSCVTAVDIAGLGVGGGGGDLVGGGGLMCDDDLGALRDFGEGSGALDLDGRLDDKLLTVAGWQGDDDDDELRQVIEASRQSHEAEMIQRATRESQEAAAAVAADGDDRLTPSPHPVPSSRPPLSSSAVITNGSGGGPDMVVLPPVLGSLEPPRIMPSGHADGTVHPGTGGGAGVNSRNQAGAGAGGDNAIGDGGAAWMGGAWDDGEGIPTFAGNGKGKGRWRD